MKESEYKNTEIRMPSTVKRQAKRELRYIDATNDKKPRHVKHDQKSHSSETGLASENISVSSTPTSGNYKQRKLQYIDHGETNACRRDSEGQHARGDPKKEDLVDPYDTDNSDVETKKKARPTMTHPSSTRRSVRHHSGPIVNHRGILVEESREPLATNLWRSLEKLGFEMGDGDSFLLPQYGDKAPLAFTSFDCLRAYLCQNGVPLPPGVDSEEAVLSPDQVLDLRRWIRMHIVTPLHGKRQVESVDSIDSNGARTIMKKLGMSAHDGGYWIPNDGLDGNMMGPLSWNEVEILIAKVGLPASVLETGTATDTEKLQLLLYMTENVDTVTFTPYVEIGPSAESKRDLGPKHHSTVRLKSVNVVKRNNSSYLDGGIPPQKENSRMSSRKAISSFCQSEAVNSAELRALETSQKKFAVVRNKRESGPLPFVVMEETVDGSLSLLDNKEGNRKGNREDEHAAVKRMMQLAERTPGAERISSIMETLRRQLQPLDEKMIVNPHEPESMEGVEELKIILNGLGSEDFREMQAQVCMAAVRGENDVAFIAPCGHGKSMCFAVPAVFEKGITLVVQPVRKLIRNQLLNFTQADCSLQVEELPMPKKPAATDRLDEILKDLSTTDRTSLTNDPGKYQSSPHVMFTTAEHASGVLLQLNKLSRCGVLKRIVIDEFDVMTDYNSSFQLDYIDLVPKLRRYCKGSKFMFLAATTTEASLRILDSDNTKYGCGKKAKVFLHPRALSDSLSFRVERKKHNAQVALRIADILKAYVNATSDTPKCLCYCLTKMKCRTMADKLCKLGIKAESVTSDDNEINRIITIVNRLKLGKIQVLCTTSVLGRTFDLDDIRFVFHSTIPTSLGRYIQEAGRAGRDGVTSYCYLFYRPQHQAKFRNLRRGESEWPDGNVGIDLSDELKTDSDVRDVLKYCTRGGMCRYSMLASHATLSRCHPEVQKCKFSAKCDNCSKCRKIEISGLVTKFLELFKIASVTKIALPEKEVDDLLQVAVLDHKQHAMYPFFDGSSLRDSLRSDVLRLLTDWDVLVTADRGKSFERASNNVILFLSQLKEGKIRLFITIIEPTAESTAFALNKDKCQYKPGQKVLEVTFTDVLMGPKAM